MNCGNVAARDLKLKAAKELPTNMLSQARCAVIWGLLAWCAVQGDRPPSARAQDVPFPEAPRQERVAVPDREPTVPLTSFAPRPPTTPEPIPTPRRELSPRQGIPQPLLLGVPVVALLDFDSDTLDSGLVEALSQALWARLGIPQDLGLLPRKPTRNWLIRNDLHPLPYHAVPLPEVARALRTEYLVTGHIDRIDSAFTLDVSIYATRQTRPIMQDVKQRQASLEEMLQAMSGLAIQLHDAIVKNELYLKTGLVPPTNHGSPTPASGRVNRHAEATAVAPKPTRKSRKSVRGHEATRPRQDNESPEAVPERSAHSEAPTHEARPEPHMPTPPRPTPSPATPTPAPTPAGDPEAAAQAYRAAQALPAQGPERLRKLKEAAALAPREALYQQQLATEYYRQGKYHESIKQADRALKRKPGDSLLLTIKGSGYFELGQYDQARRANEAALKANPRNNWARYNLALVLTEGKSPGAAQAWREYLKQAQDDPSQQELLGEARKALSTLESATRK